MIIFASAAIPFLDSVYLAVAEEMIFVSAVIPFLDSAYLVAA
jgi:hypothetical protein